MRTLLLRLFALAAAGTLLAGSSCSTSNNGSGSSSTTTQSATGVWTGTDSVSGLNITALIASGGQGTFIRSDGVQFTGSVQVSGSTLAVTVDGYSGFGSTFSDGSTYGIGSLDGTVATATTLTATLIFTTNDNTAISGNFSLTYSPLASTTSSVATISGNYSDSASGATVSITSSGAMTSQNATNSCVLNGSISTTNSSYNVYTVSYTYEDCTGSYAALNGVQLTGLASYAPNVSPVQLLIAVTGSSSAGNYGIVTTLTGS